MNIVITQWALDAYLNLKRQRAFTSSEYWHVIRPDVLLLKKYPNEVKFNNGKFWSPATLNAGQNISNGFKMKWHQMGNGKIQLRLTVALSHDSFLCEAYVKSDDKEDKRKLAKFKTYIQLIQLGRHTTRGILL